MTTFFGKLVTLVIYSQLMLFLVEIYAKEEIIVNNNNTFDTPCDENSDEVLNGGGITVMDFMMPYFIIGAICLLSMVAYSMQVIILKLHSNHTTKIYVLPHRDCPQDKQKVIYF